MAVSAFAAATPLPMNSELVFLGLLATGTVPLWSLVLIASIANTAGSFLTYGIGRGIGGLAEGRFALKDGQRAQAARWFARWGGWAPLLAWAPGGGLGGGGGGAGGCRGLRRGYFHEEDRGSGSGLEIRAFGIYLWGKEMRPRMTLPPLTLYLAAPRGFCAGVDRAIKIVELAIEKWGAPVYVRHEIVHNKFVVDALRAKGAVFVEELDDCPTERRAGHR